MTETNEVLAQLARRSLLTESLRSGEYRQGKGFLRETNGSAYCCLGVACDIYHKQTGKGRWENRTFYDNDGYNSNATLPPDVKEWFGFQTGSGTINKSVVIEKNLDFSTLDSLNDFAMDFKQIADLIDSNPEGMFHD